MVVRLKPWELIQILIILKILYQKRILILILIVIQLIYVIAIHEDIFFFQSRDNLYPHQFGWRPSQEDLDSKLLNHKHYLEKHKPDLVRKFFKHLIDQNSKKLFKELTDV